MLQAVMVKPGKILFKKIDKPEPKENEVLVKIKRIGICGSDMHVYHGTYSYIDYPVVQGHEVSGIIEKTGSLMESFSKGDKVILLPQITCGTCYSCRHGMYHICDELKCMGFQTNGAAQEYISVNKGMILKIPDKLSFNIGAMLEPSAVAIHAISRGEKISGKKVLVLGAGPIGNLIGQAVKGLGANQVMITDPSEFRLNISRECGVDFVLNPDKENLDNAILNNFGKDRADIIFECVGIQETITQAISVAREGSKIIIVGVFREKPTIDIRFVQHKELSLIGTLMYQKSDFLKAIELTEKGKFLQEKIITNEFPFLKYLDAYKYILEKNDKVMKVIISFD